MLKDEQIFSQNYTDTNERAKLLCSINYHRREN